MEIELFNYFMLYFIINLIIKIYLICLKIILSEKINKFMEVYHSYPINIFIKHVFNCIISSNVIKINVCMKNLKIENYFLKNKNYP